MGPFLPGTVHEWIAERKSRKESDIEVNVFTFALTAIAMFGIFIIAIVALTLYYGRTLRLKGNTKINESGVSSEVDINIDKNNLYKKENNQ